MHGCGGKVHPEDLEHEAAYNRDMAAQARQMAGSLPLESDRTRLERYANELERHAAELEAQARALRPFSSSAPTLTWRQQQRKQKQATKDEAAARHERKH
jgi:hypothetical protein